MTAKKIIKYLCVFVVVPLIVLCGVFFFGDRKYAFISLALSVVACIPFFISFEKVKRCTQNCYNSCYDGIVCSGQVCICSHSVF